MNRYDNTMRIMRRHHDKILVNSDHLSDILMSNPTAPGHAAPGFPPGPTQIATNKNPEVVKKYVNFHIPISPVERSLTRTSISECYFRGFWSFLHVMQGKWYNIQTFPELSGSRTAAYDSHCACAPNGSMLSYLVYIT